MTQTAALIEQAAPASMLYDGLCKAYSDGTARLENTAGVSVVGRSSQNADTQRTQGAPVVFRTDAKSFIATRELGEEVFGPATLFVAAGQSEQLEQIARNLDGQLTATIHGTEDDLKQHAALVDILADRAGRVIFNGFPTGVEVCPSMNHGGPYPATTDAHFTSVGTAAIYRFARPVCYQDFPQSALPAELRDNNERKIMRMINNQSTRDNA
jgi:alpha-ketoglutaric semialdehyde dehydrogenase